MPSARLTKIAARALLIALASPEVAVASGARVRATTLPHPLVAEIVGNTRVSKRAPPRRRPAIWAKRHGGVRSTTSARGGSHRGLGLVEVASDVVRLADGAQRGLRLRAAGHRECAARPEPAAGWRIDRVRRVAGERRSFETTVRIEARRRREQRLRVWMLGGLGQRVGGPRLDDLAEVHDEHAAAHVLYHVEVVRDEHVRQRAL